MVKYFAIHTRPRAYLILIVFIIGRDYSIAAFGFTQQRLKNHHPEIIKRGSHHRLFSSSGDNIDDDGTLKIAASKRLGWEIDDEISQKPILDLSMRNEEINNGGHSKKIEDDTSDWDRGQRWKITLEILSNLCLQNSTGDIATATSTATIQEKSILKICPQLFRLEPSSIQKTAQWIIDEFGIEYLKTSVLIHNPVILSYKQDDAVYGLEFMSMMMMMDAKTACAASPALLLQGINGGIQERLVGNALGAASNATSKAAKSIASDNMASLRQLQRTSRFKR